MGCGVSAQAASEYQRMMQEVTKMRQETEEAVEDREAMEGEVGQLRRQVTELTEENEFLKERIDRLVNFEHPCIFDDSKGPDELIANWIEMDLRDGDELLAALARVHPESEQDVRGMLEVSASIRRTESTLQQYCGYFASRFKLYNVIWAKVVGVHFVLDDSFRGMKEAIAQAVQSVETLVGKKSATMDQLTTDVRDLFKLKYGDFINEYRRINGVIENIRLENMLKKLEDKEAERQRLLARYESDMKSINIKHTSELQTQNDETAKMRTNFLQSLETQKAQFTAEIAQLRAIHEQELKIRYDTEERMDTNYTTEKAYMKASLKAKNNELRAEFETMMDTFREKQADTQRQIVEKCQQTIHFYEEKIVNLQTAHTFELQERLSEATNSRSMCYEDIRQELMKRSAETAVAIATLEENSRIETARRDLEVQELKELHKGELLDTVVLLRNWQSSTKEVIEQEFSSVYASMQAVYAQVTDKLQVDHEEYIQTLREDCERQMVELREELIRTKEREMDERERQRAGEICEMAHKFGEIFGSVLVLGKHRAIQSIESLAPFSLNLHPAFDLPHFPQNSPLASEIGLELYSKAVNQLQSTLNTAQETTELSLQTMHQALSRLSAAWLDLESARSALQKQLETATEDLAAAGMELKAKDASIFEITEEMVSLKAEIESKEGQITQLQTQLRFVTDSTFRENSEKTQKRLFTSFMKKLNQVKRSFLFKWRMKSSNKPIVEEPAPVPEESEEEDDGELQHIEQILLEEKKKLLENNVVMETFQKAGKPEKPLSAPQVVKFFEEMMDQKYDADIRDLKNQKPLKPLPDYMLDHLNRIFGLKKLALKNLSQLMPALESMYSDQDPNHLLLCRLIQVLHPDPVPYQLGVFLTKIRVEFIPFMEKYQKDKEARESRKNLGKKESKAAGNVVAPQEAYLVDTIGYIYSLFENDRRSGELMLKLLQPSSVQMIDYLIFKLCHKMAKLGLNVEGLFSMLDPHGFGYIDEHDFITKSRRELELWVSTEDLSTLFRDMSGGHKELNKAMFSGKINYKLYLEHCKSDLYIVTRQQFLICLIEVYHTRQRRDGVYLMNKIGKEAFFTKEQVIEKLRNIEATLEQDRAEELYQQALSHASDPESGVDQRSLLKTILQNPLGLMKKNKEEFAENAKLATPRRSSIMPPDASPLPRRHSMMVPQLGGHKEGFAQVLARLVGKNPSLPQSTHVTPPNEPESIGVSALRPSHPLPKIVITAPEETSESSDSSPSSPGQNWLGRTERSLSIPNAKQIVAIENEMEEEKEDREERKDVADVIESDTEIEKTEGQGLGERKALEIVVEAAEPMEANIEVPRLSETTTETSRPSEVPIEVPKFQAAPAPNSLPATLSPFPAANSLSIDSCPFPVSSSVSIDPSPFPVVPSPSSTTDRSFPSNQNPFPNTSSSLSLPFLLPPSVDSQESAAKPATRPNPQPAITSAPSISPVLTSNGVKSPVRPSPKPVEKSRAASTAPRKPEPISKKAGAKLNSPKATYAPKTIPKTRR